MTPNVAGSSSSVYATAGWVGDVWHVRSSCAGCPCGEPLSGNGCATCGYVPQHTPGLAERGSGILRQAPETKATTWAWFGRGDDPEEFLSSSCRASLFEREPYGRVQR